MGFLNVTLLEKNGAWRGARAPRRQLQMQRRPPALQAAPRSGGAAPRARETGPGPASPTLHN